MDANQFKLLFNVLERFQQEGVLSKIVLVGSWCLPLYQDYYFKGVSLPPLRTRGVDFLIARKTKFAHKTDIPELLIDLGFVLDQEYMQGYMRLNHPELVIEFLVPEVGKGSDKPFPLPDLAMNAQTLRFLDMLNDKPVIISVNGMEITIPHPVNFGLNKLITGNRRKSAEKQTRDISAGISVLDACVQQGEAKRIKALYLKQSKQTRKLIRKCLEEQIAQTVLDILPD